MLFCLYFFKNALITPYITQKTPNFEPTKPSTRKMIPIYNTSLSAEVDAQLPQHYALHQKYVANQLIPLNLGQISALTDAVQLLYQLYTSATDQIIAEQKWKGIDMPYNMLDIINFTWQHKRQHLPLCLRFDLAGGVANLPIKLLACHADNEVFDRLFEATILQNHHLKINQLAQNAPFETALVAQLSHLLAANPQKNATLLLTYFAHQKPSTATRNTLTMVAQKAGFAIEHKAIEDVILSPTEGMVVDDGWDRYRNFDFCCLLADWEDLAFDHLPLLDSIANLILHKKVVMINPPYTMLWQSVGVQRYLWEWYKFNDLLLPTTLQPPARYSKYMAKPIWGVEGTHTTIFDEKGKVLLSNHEAYPPHSLIYQPLPLSPTDLQGNTYRTAVYYVPNKACTIGFRQGNLLPNPNDKWVGSFTSE